VSVTACEGILRSAYILVNLILASVFLFIEFAFFVVLDKMSDLFIETWTFGIL
jgi:hypothetical protein